MTASDKRETVVLVHGIWMLGLEMKLLARRLRLAGYRVRQFRYPSIVGTAEENVESLRQFAVASEGETVHFVCHSMGGLLTHELFAKYPEQRPGRILAMGTPFNGSWTAERLCQLRLERATLGKTLLPLLERRPARWMADRELGIMAGTYPLGIGAVLGTMPGPNDGTVSVAETELPGAIEHRCEHVNHFGLLVSRGVFGRVTRFLRTGRFS